MAEHVYAKCSRQTCPTCKGHGVLVTMKDCRTCGGNGYTKCGGCRGEGMDCFYDVLAACTVCGGIEGSLLPFCPGRWLTPEECTANYAHYCEGTGPFARLTLLGVAEASDAVLLRKASKGNDLLQDSLTYLWRSITYGFILLREP